MLKSKFLLGVAMIAVLAAPAAAQVFHPESFTLKNGLQVVVVSNHRAPVVTHMLWLRAGASQDPWGKSGIAHFQEHLMFKGTKNHAEGDYSRMISERGGRQNAFTSQDFTAYYATIGKDDLPIVMDLEADRLANWQVTQKQVDAEKKVIIKERQQTVENEPIQSFWEEVSSQLYVNHPYQRPTIGWPKEIAGLDKKSIEDFHAAYYAPDQMILVLSGDIDKAEAQQLAEKYYSGLRPSGKKAPETPEAIPLTAKRRIVKTSPQVKEVLWSMHYLTDPARPETIAVSDAQSVLAKMLGDNRIGRLYRRLVKQEKLATSASISFDPIARGKTRFMIMVVPKPDSDLTKIESIVREETAAIAAKAPTAKEVGDATQAMQIETIYARDGVMTPAMVIGESLVAGLDLETIESWPTRIQKVTPEDVQNAAKNLFELQTPLIAVLKPEPVKEEVK